MLAKLGDGVVTRRRSQSKKCTLAKDRLVRRKICFQEVTVLRVISRACVMCAGESVNMYTFLPAVSNSLCSYILIGQMEHGSLIGRDCVSSNDYTCINMTVQ